MSDDGTGLAVDEFVDYCRTQAGLLAGSVETMSAELDALLDEIDAETAQLRERLEAQEAPDGPTAPQSADGPADGASVLAALEEREEALEEKQALAEAKQARMAAYQDLASGYTDLAEQLQADAADGREALTRVVRFEADRDAPAYFPERTTVYEAAADAADDG